MQGTKLTPEKITSPFQLMAAWFAMLVLVVSVLLAAAANISKPEWAAGYLVVFSSVMIVLVLSCVTLMLTVYRPHLQDGKDYAQWLKDKNTYSQGAVLREEKPARSRRRTPIVKQASDASASIKSCSVSVTNAPAAEELVESLRKAGFFAEIYIEQMGTGQTNSYPEHMAIWVGYRVSAQEAIEAIKIGVKIWPHLKYVHLSNDGGSPPDEVHDELYLGGATSTAKDYALEAWSAEDFSRLAKEMSQEDFHRFIRRKYP